MHCISKTFITVKNIFALKPFEVHLFNALNINYVGLFCSDLKNQGEIRQENRMLRYFNVLFRLELRQQGLKKLNSAKRTKEP